VGRTALLARLDQVLIAEPADRWVVVTGGPGMGKSALLAQWLARREAIGFDEQPIEAGQQLPSSDKLLVTSNARRPRPCAVAEPGHGHCERRHECNDFGANEA
jgi:hypothetical protein